MIFLLKYYYDETLFDLLRQANIKTYNQLMVLMIIVGNTVHTLVELQEHILYLIKVGQLNMAHMFQDQFPNQVHKVSIMQHVLHECL